MRTSSLQRSADGVPFILPDGTADRTTDGTGNIPPSSIRTAGASADQWAATGGAVRSPGCRRCGNAGASATSMHRPPMGSRSRVATGRTAPAKMRGLPVEAGAVHPVRSCPETDEAVGRDADRPSEHVERSAFHASHHLTAGARPASGKPPRPAPDFVSGLPPSNP